MATASLTSPEDIINAALAKTSYRKRVGSIWDGSDAAKIALDVYAQTRDDILRTNDWPFARRDAILVLLKQAPNGGYATQPWSQFANPSLPYRYEYYYPFDSLRVRSIRQADDFLIDCDPRDNLFTVANDDMIPTSWSSAFSSDFGPFQEQKVLLCDVPPNAVATYTAQITDPITMDADFVQVLISAMGKRLAEAFNKPQNVKLSAQDKMHDEAEADVTQGG